MRSPSGTNDSTSVTSTAATSGPRGHARGKPKARVTEINTDAMNAAKPRVVRALACRRQRVQYGTINERGPTSSRSTFELDAGSPQQAQTPGAIASASINRTRRPLGALDWMSGEESIPSTTSRDDRATYFYQRPHGASQHDGNVTSK
jgi:hypothetical protein